MTVTVSHESDPVSRMSKITAIVPNSERHWILLGLKI